MNYKITAMDLRGDQFNPLYGKSEAVDLEGARLSRISISESQVVQNLRYLSQELMFNPVLQCPITLEPITYLVVSNGCVHFADADSISGLVDSNVCTVCRHQDVTYVAIDDLFKLAERFGIEKKYSDVDLGWLKRVCDYLLSKNRQQVIADRVRCYPEQAIEGYSALSTATPLELLGHIKAITGVVVLDDGRLVTGSRDHSVRVWDLKTAHFHSYAVNDDITDLQVVDRHAVVSCFDGIVQMIALDTHHVVTLHCRDDAQTKFSGNALKVRYASPYLVAGFADGSLRTWEYDANTGVFYHQRFLVPKTREFLASIYSLEVQHGLVLAGSLGNRLMMVDLASGRRAFEFSHPDPNGPMPSNWIGAQWFSSDELIVSSIRGRMDMYYLPSRKLELIHQCDTCIKTFAISDNLLVVGYVDGLLRVFERQPDKRWRLVQDLLEHQICSRDKSEINKSVSQIIIKNRTIYCGAYNGTARIWDYDPCAHVWRQRCEFVSRYAVEHIAVSEDQPQLFVGLSSGIVQRHLLRLVR